MSTNRTELTEDIKAELAQILDQNDPTRESIISQLLPLKKAVEHLQDLITAHEMAFPDTLDDKLIAKIKKSKEQLIQKIENDLKKIINDTTSKSKDALVSLFSENVKLIQEDMKQMLELRLQILKQEIVLNQNTIMWLKDEIAKFDPYIKPALVIRDLNKSSGEMHKVIAAAEKKEIEALSLEELKLLIANSFQYKKYFFSDPQIVSLQSEIDASTHKLSNTNLSNPQKLGLRREITTKKNKVNELTEATKKNKEEFNDLIEGKDFVAHMIHRVRQLDGMIAQYNKLLLKVPKAIESTLKPREILTQIEAHQNQKSLKTEQ